MRIALIAIRTRLLHFRDRQNRLLTPAVETLSTYQSNAVNTQETMKTKVTNSSLILILAASRVAFFAGCASSETDNNTKSLLSQAGFRMRSPKTAKQKELYSSLPNNKVEHAIVKGKVFYLFKDEKAGVDDVCGEPEYRCDNHG